MAREEIKPTIYRFQEAAKSPIPDFAQAESLQNQDPNQDSFLKSTFSSIFSAPVRLGENIAGLLPEVQRARESVDRLRDRGGEFATLADELDKEIVKRPSTAEVIGNALGTALWVAPLPLLKGLKAAPVLNSIVRGGAYGAAFGAADALGEGLRMEKVLTNAIVGGVIGAPLGLATHGIFKLVGGAGKGVLKSVSDGRIADAGKRLFSPTISRLQEFGYAGKEIAKRFQEIGVNAKRKMGEAMIKMSEIGLVDVPRLFPWQVKTKMMDTASAWRGKNSLLDILTGKGSLKKAGDAVKKAAKVAREMLDDIAVEAKGKKILPGKRQNYFTHLIPSSKSVALSKTERNALAGAKTLAEREAIYLQSKAKVSLRRDILENAVFKERAFNTIDDAGRTLDSWAFYVSSGKRAINEKTKPFLKYILKTGQAKSLQEAESKAFRDFLRKPISRIPKFGPLEHARKIDFPFWDPDPRRVLPNYTLGAIARIEAATKFGAKNEKLNRLIANVGKKSGVQAASEVDDLVRKITGQIKTAPAREQISTTLRMLQVPKLAYAQIINIGQSTNTLLASDLGSLASGIQSAFSNKGVQKALKTGAILNSVLKRELAYAGGGSNFANNILKYSGFTWTETFNRVVASNAGMKYAEKTFARLKKNPQSKVLRWRLQELGVNPAEALKRGSLIEKELLNVGNMFSAKTQFLSEPMYLPAWASSPEGKVVFQFKNFAYNQAVFIKRQLLNKNIPLTRKARTLLILGMVYPMTGEVLGDIRAFLTGVKRPTKAWDRYWNNIANAGTFGLAVDFWESAKFRNTAEAVVGPTVGSIADLTESAVASLEAGEWTDGLMKTLLRQTGVLRPVANFMYPTKRKNMGDVLEFWDKL